MTDNVLCVQSIADYFNLRSPKYKHQTGIWLTRNVWRETLVKDKEEWDNRKRLQTVIMSNTYAGEREKKKKKRNWVERISRLQCISRKHSARLMVVLESKFSHKEPITCRNRLVFASPQYSVSMWEKTMRAVVLAKTWWWIQRGRCLDINQACYGQEVWFTYSLLESCRLYILHKFRHLLLYDSHEFLFLKEKPWTRSVVQNTPLC